MLKPKQISFLPLLEMGEDELPSSDSLHVSASSRWAIAKIEGEDVEKALRRFLKNEYPRMSESQHEHTLVTMLGIVADLEQKNLSETQPEESKPRLDWTPKQLADAKAHAKFHERRTREDD